MLRIADDGDVAMGDAAVLDRLNRSRGQVDHHIAFIEGEIDPRKAIGARGELVEPHPRRNVDGLQRRAGDDSGLAEPHARLEALDPRREPVVPGESARLSPRQVAFDRQPLTQLCDRRALRSGPDRGDVRWPAARVHNRRIALRRLGGGEESVGLKGWARIVAERGLARRRRRRDFLRLRRRRGLRGNGRSR
jgi:hypothetical protein